MTALLALLAGIGVGALLVWLALRSKTARLEREVNERQGDLGLARTELARLEATVELEREAAAERAALLDRTKDELSDTFKALSAEALRTNQTSFLEVAGATLERYHVEARDDLEQRRQAVETLVAPLRESLTRVDGQIRHLEQARSQAYGSLSEQLRSVAETQERLRAETGNLVNALRTPAARGRWGEIQLRRVVEIAGMLAHCDFVEQVTATADERRLRPDLIVKLPGGKNVVVDAKAPLQAYLESLEAPDEATRALRLADHARQIREHVVRLSMKGYWEQFRPTPEFVVLFIPGEAFYSAALEQDPGLIEEGVAQRVLIATPTTLIGVLKAVAYGWQQETVAESARAVSELGRELHARIATLGEHVLQLGRRLDGAVQAYNQTVGSLERRVLPAARRFGELGAAGSREIPSLEPIDKTSQLPQAPELRDEPEPTGAAPERDGGADDGPRVRDAA
jgi:DNA recombination protein RmuC